MNTMRVRLARLYGDDARLTLRREEEATVAEIVIPWRVEGDGR
jgi:hypothetical protein